MFKKSDYPALPDVQRRQVTFKMAHGITASTYTTLAMANIMWIIGNRTHLTFYSDNNNDNILTVLSMHVLTVMADSEIPVQEKD